MSTPKTYRAFVSPEPLALGDLCIDPRFLPGVTDYLEELGFVEYTKEPEPGQKGIILLKGVGGPASLAHPRTKAVDYASHLHEIVHTRELFPSIEEFHMFGHQDCGFYRSGVRISRPNMERHDLIKIRRVIANATKIIPILHYAYFTNDTFTRIAFEVIP